MILDTNAISALLAGDKKLEKKLSKSLKHHLASIVLGEYRYGLTNSAKERELGALLDLLEQESYRLVVNSETARFYAKIRHSLRKKGMPIPENDIWIAALAQQYDQEIVSKDKHFDYVEGVTRIGW